MAPNRRIPNTLDFDDEVHRLVSSLANVLRMLYVHHAETTLTQPVERTEDTGLANVIADRLAALERSVVEVRQIVTGQHLAKEWYTTGELAEILGRSQFTVQERWCNDGRIECEKDPDSGKWRIPAHELQRLRAGGGLRPKPSRDRHG